MTEPECTSTNCGSLFSLVSFSIVAAAEHPKSEFVDTSFVASKDLHPDRQDLKGSVYDNHFVDHKT